jgi:hypothetical protein
MTTSYAFQTSVSPPPTGPSEGERIVAYIRRTHPLQGVPGMTYLHGHPHRWIEMYQSRFDPNATISVSLRVDAHGAIGQPSMIETTRPLSKTGERIPARGDAIAPGFPNYVFFNTAGGLLWFEGRMPDMRELPDYTY